MKEKRRNKVKTNSVGAKTLKMESTKMTKIIISQKKNLMVKRKERRKTMRKREMTTVVKMIKEKTIKN
jgi:hypothetical protein